jgi:long-chain acyl-CoA synthetase
MSKQLSTYMPVAVSDGIRASAAARPEKIALVEAERSLTYQQLVARFNRVANGLADVVNLDKGDHIALMSSNCLEFIEIVCGAADAGLATAMVNPRLTANEAAYICNDSQAKILFVHADLEEMMQSAPLETVEKIIVIGKEYDDWLFGNSEVRPSLELSETDIFAIPYTAGTTGHPKGVLLPHRSRALTFFAMAVEYGCYSSDDRSLAIAPLFHGAGFAFAVAPIFFGGFCEILVKFEPEQVLKKIAENNITNTFMVPTHFNAIFALPDNVLTKYSFPEFRTLISNAAPLPQATKERIVGYFGDGRLHECYGSTEGGIVCSLRPVDQLRKVKCVGKPFPCTEVKIVDKEGSDVEVGEIGELFSRSPYLFSGYWQKPEETQGAVKNGWFSAGDMAMYDDEGYIYLVDRMKDMIISGGVNIYPRDIEEVLHTHPDVAEAAVIGVADDYWGEKVKAYVVARDTQVLTDEILLTHCEGKLASYKMPKEFSFIDALPRNAAGKVLRRALREPT